MQWLTTMGVGWQPTCPPEVTVLVSGYLELLASKLKFYSALDWLGLGLKLYYNQQSIGQSVLVSNPAGAQDPLLSQYHCYDANAFIPEEAMGK
jgi:hypothetical protein